MHDLISPPLYNPIWKVDRHHSFTDGYVVEEDFVSETCNVLTQNYYTTIFKTNCFLLFQVSRADCT
jgi:hypothetical protein